MLCVYTYMCIYIYIYIYTHIYIYIYIALCVRLCLRFSIPIPASISSLFPFSCLHLQLRLYSASDPNPAPLVWRVGWKIKMSTLLDVCVSPLRRGHANLLCVVPNSTDDPRRESWRIGRRRIRQVFACSPCGDSHTRVSGAWSGLQ